jgi:hypothetical protein
MIRPLLNEVSLDKVMAIKGPHVTVNVDQGEWDWVRQSFYDQGLIIVELDEDETPVKAYQKLLDS